MESTSTLSPADQAENEIYAADFAARLAAGETISTATWSCKVIAGVDTNASSRLFGSPTISGTQTRQRVTGLRAGVTYRLQAIVTTSNSNILSCWGPVVSKV